MEAMTDSLPDMLNDFSGKINIKKAEAEAVSGPGRPGPAATAAVAAAAAAPVAAPPTASTAIGGGDAKLEGDGLPDDEFEKQFQAGMADLLGEIQNSVRGPNCLSVLLSVGGEKLTLSKNQKPDMQAHFEAFMKDFAGDCCSDHCRRRVAMRRGRPRGGRLVQSGGGRRRGCGLPGHYPADDGADAGIRGPGDGGGGGGGGGVAGPRGRADEADDAAVGRRRGRPAARAATRSSPRCCWA